MRYLSVKYGRKRKGKVEDSLYGTKFAKNMDVVTGELMNRMCEPYCSIEQPKVTVIIPVYKVEAYLLKCVQSVEEQNYCNLSIILVDDGSSDRCPQLCDELAEQYNNIKIIHKENGGLSSARNAGLNLIEKEGTDYVFFLDSDDTMPASTIKKLVDIAEKEQADLVLPDRYNLIDERTNKQNIHFHFSENMYEKLPSAFAREVLIKKGRAWRAHSVLYRYSIIAKYKIQFPIGRISEDIVFNLQFMRYAEKMEIIPEITVNYLKRRGSITSTYQPYYEEDIWYIDDCVQRFLSNTCSDNQMNRKYADALLARNLILYLFSIFSHNNNLEWKEKVTKAKMIISHTNSRNVVRKRQECPWFEYRKARIGFSAIAWLLCHNMDCVAFYIMSKL